MRQTVALFAALIGIAAHGAGKPNILVIYSDDHGWADLGAQGVNTEIRTPNLDKLASDGVRFARGYVTAPQCVPSRAGVLTGRHQQRFGVEDNSKGPLPLEELTIAEQLKPAGYVTGQVGKWHLDLPSERGRGKGGKAPIPAHMPQGQGFDEYWRGEMRRYCASHDLKGNAFPDAPHWVDDDRFRVVVQTEAALSFLDRRTAQPQQPWFLYLAWFAPHVPLESPEPWFSRTPAALPLERRQALAMMAAMDDGLGQIRQKLEASGMARDTLIFFIGDNGAPLKKGAWNGSVNLPLTGEKGMLTDGGIRTPFVAAWPGTLPAGLVYQHPVSALDVAATAVAVAKAPADDKLDGVNLMPYLAGGNSGPPHENLFWRWRSQSAILEFPWKLIRLGPSEQFLFDVTSPAGEKDNQITRHPEIAERLNVKLQKWSEGLQPPGLPVEPNEQDNIFFADHLAPQLATTIKKREKRGEPPGTVQGWLCRNGQLAVRDGALAVTPDAVGKTTAFITNAQLDLAGPITITLQTRARQGGKGSTSWRTRKQSDFSPDQHSEFHWPASEQWQEVSSTIPATGNLIHLRITLPKDGQDIEIKTILLSDANGKKQSWSFDAKH